MRARGNKGKAVGLVFTSASNERYCKRILAISVLASVNQSINPFINYPLNEKSGAIT